MSEIFSLFKQPITHNLRPVSNVGLQQVFEYLTDPETGANTLHLRRLIAAGQTEAAKAWKLAQFPGVTFSATFAPTRAAANLQTFSGLLCVDFDHLQNIEAARARLLNYENMRPVLLFTSPSGNGIKAVYRLPAETTAASFADVWRAAAFTLKADLHLEADPACKDLSRLCFLPFDPYAVLNMAAPPVELYTPPAPLLRPSRPRPTPTSSAPTTGGNFGKFEAAQRICDTAQRRGIDITGTYNEWIICALSLAYFGERGRALFHQISGQYGRYTPAEADRQYNAALVSRGAKSIEPFFELAKNYGLYAKTK